MLIYIYYSFKFQFCCCWCRECDAKISSPHHPSSDSTNSLTLGKHHIFFLFSTIRGSLTHPSLTVCAHNALFVVLCLVNFIVPHTLPKNLLLLRPSKPTQPPHIATYTYHYHFNHLCCASQHFSQFQTFLLLCFSSQKPFSFLGKKFGLISFLVSCDCAILVSLILITWFR